jgi:hypothetical protein
MLQTYCSLEAYCANLWRRGLVFSISQLMEKAVEWNLQGKTEVLGGEKPDPVPLWPPKGPHGVTWDWTRASAVGGQRLTAWAVARPISILTFPIRRPCWVEFNVRDLHVPRMSNWEFHENRFSTSNTLLIKADEIWPLFLHFFDLDKVSKVSIKQICSGIMSFVKICEMESILYFLASMNFYSDFPCLFSKFGEIPNKR